MRVSGFSFIKDAIKYDYPIIEAITSILPLCNDFYIAVGKSEDKTLELISGINSPKIKIIETEWDESLRIGGKVLAEETNKAFAQIPKDTDWAFYIQGDEVIHEKYLDTIYNGMEKYLKVKEIEGLLFKYLHFYGSYDYVGTSLNWYPNETRIIRNNKSIYSFGDAKGFRKGNNEKLTVAAIDAYVYHYGWVKPPEAMQRKQENFNKYWHDDQWVENHILKTKKFDYLKHVSSLNHFSESHPKVMIERIDVKNWKFEYDISFNKKTFKEIIKTFFKNNLNLDFSPKNYKILK